ncbi:hypothetical protein P152DRAFT_461384 [Eremomyces bilateralis CBS 781.70]|uniref:Uncharacterized protein n=1 Tax=Eremomyces bilateralis CBS 781.70 TaxID=1392243 RepID=A0A6G1FUT1_9PEZI|nr:uncharacterized protein P152DRAFT_461384 [Eremomyces bilateralis CBS 781.70]KAF1809442.1 hypothetical protein P152DRAFT_461384 [Eremomyces bilateralis CBS 781.70]
MASRTLLHLSRTVPSLRTTTRPLLTLSPTLRTQTKAAAPVHAVRWYSASEAKTAKKYDFDSVGRAWTLSMKGNGR